MPEEQKQVTKPEPRKSYYTATDRKVLDFFAGLAGCPLLLWAGVKLSGLQGSTGNTGVAVAILLVLGFLMFFLYRGRKYVAIGMLSAVLLPLIVVGGCMLVIYGGR